MPHDKFKRLIEVGDVIKARPYNQKNFGVEPDREFVGVITEIHSGEQSCTGQFDFGVKSEEAVVTQRDYFGAEDAEIILKADGTFPEVPSVNA